MPAYEDYIDGARRATADFLSTLDRARRVCVFCHFDADGLAAGALFGRALPRMGFSDVRVLHAGREESAFEEPARSRVAQQRPGVLIVADLGVDRAGVVPGVPTLYVDHHEPHGEPPDAVVVSGYGWDPVPTSAWLAYEVLEPLVDVRDLDWIAAVGTMGDLGAGAPWPRLPAVKRRHTARWLTEAVSLINAARRASAFDVATPLRLLLEADGPRAVSNDRSRGAERLHAYRAEVQAELALARRRPPTFSKDGRFALIRFGSRCQIHPLIAQQWRGRLSKQVVIAANTGYAAGHVAFSARTALPDVRLPELLRSVDLGGYTSRRFGRGHDRASGGHLPPGIFNRLLAGLGFGPEAFVSEGGEFPPEATDPGVAA